MGRNPANPPVRPSQPALQVAQQPAIAAQGSIEHAPTKQRRFDPLSEDPAR
jgi:hypothetical protein